VSRLAPRSLLLVHGTADQVLPDWCSRYLYEEAGEPKLPDDDEIVKAIRLSQGGKVVNERLTAA